MIAAGNEPFQLCRVSDKNGEEEEEDWHTVLFFNQMFVTHAFILIILVAIIVRTMFCKI